MPFPDAVVFIKLIIMVYFLAGVRGNKRDEKGYVRRVMDRYLVDAINPTEAETKIVKELASVYEGISIEKLEMKETMEKTSPNDDGYFYYEVSIAFLSLDEKTGKEKSTSRKMYVLASGFDAAKSMVDEYTKGFAGSFTIESIRLTKILDLVQ